MKELTENNFAEIIKSNKNVIVQYGAAWCGACRIVKPQFSKLSEEYNNIEFYYVDAEKFPEARQLAQVENLPTFASFVDGGLHKQLLGTKIEKIKELADEIANN
jgi:thiol-disulfide isomerase/thioredoxin